MVVFKVGDWVELDANHYHASRLRTGMIGYFDGIMEYKVGFRPTYHPDGNPVENNVRWVNKYDVKLLPVQLTGEDIYELINLALSNKDESAFNELVSRWEYLMYLTKGEAKKNTK
ncbi:hypothetical protein ACQKGD_10845 [Peribacillus frigoritolerans]|uniref:hypothetical protein n=1 Tax=Peribacillus frigoritolerans TaxID=450367 RepID=UPI003D0379A0